MEEWAAGVGEEGAIIIDENGKPSGKIRVQWTNARIGCLDSERVIGV